MKNLLIPLCTALLVQTCIVQSQNNNVTLAAQLSYGSQRLANIGGWKSPVDGKEYALVGAANGLSIVDVTTPSSPVQIIQIPGPTSTWREVKTVGNYAYITTESNVNIGLQIVELTNLPATNLAVSTWKPEIGIDTLKTIHSLHADGGKVYLYGSNVGNGGCIIADVSSTPMSPVYLGSYDPQYVHDGYVRNDTLYAADIWAGECAVVDVSNPAAPIVLANFQTPNNFTHNTWLSQDSKTCFTTDEVDNSYLASFDISNLGNISELDRIQSNPGSNSVVHNTHIVRKNGVDYAVTSWYKDGITIVDASRPNNLVQVGNYDTSPMSGSGMDGCWGVYPFLPSGTIVASDMQDGLFVLTPDYVRACYLEGVVTDCINSNPLNGVTVQISITNPNSNSNIDITDGQGNYAAGTAAPGSYQVIYSKPGYINDTITVSLSAGIVTLKNVQLCPSAQFTLTGQIYDNSTSMGIPGTNVRIQDVVKSWDTTTDAGGNFSIPTMYGGTFEVAAGKWGYVTKCLGSQNINSSTAPISMGLDKGIYDDFTWDWGWTVSGNADTGKWERGEPLGTDIGVPFNPEYDVTTDCSVEAYVTGNKGVLPGFYDMLDGKVTVLTSPPFDLSGYTTPRLYCSLWEVILMNVSSSPDDTIKIMLSNGITTATLATYTALYWMGQWTDIVRNISTYLTPTSTMNLIVRVVDNSATDAVIIEAGFDKFYIEEMSNPSVNDIENNKAGVLVYPNPFSNRASLVVTNPEYSGHITNMKLKVYDLIGQEVHISAVRNAEGFLINRGNLTPGMYFYKLTDSNKLISTGKLLIK